MRKRKGRCSCSGLSVGAHSFLRRRAAEAGERQAQQRQRGRLWLIIMGDVVDHLDQTDPIGVMRPLPWSAVLGARALPRDIVVRWNGEIDRILQLPDVKERLVGNGMEPVGGGPEPESRARAGRGEVAEGGRNRRYQAGRVIPSA